MNAVDAFNHKISAVVSAHHSPHKINLSQMNYDRNNKQRNTNSRTNSRYIVTPMHVYTSIYVVSDIPPLQISLAFSITLGPLPPLKSEGLIIVLIVSGSIPDWMYISDALSAREESRAGTILRVELSRNTADNSLALSIV